MRLLLVILILLFVFGGGGYYGYSHYPTYGPGIGLIELIVVVCLVVYLFRRGDGI